MTYQPYSLYTKILYSSISAFLFFGSILPLLRPFVHPFIHLDTTFTINTSSLQKKSPICLNELSQIEQKYLSKSLKKYLQVNAFPDLAVLVQEE